MREERRRGVATAAVGAGMLAGGGKLRHAGVKRVIATTGKEPKIHGLALLKHGDRPAKLRYAGGSLLGLVGTAPLGVGTLEAIRGRKVDKRDKDPLWREGLRGTGDALKQRGESLATPVPKDVRAAQLGVAGGAGWAGSALARAALHSHPGGKPLLGPIAGGLAGVASLPLSNKAVQRRNRDYVVTPAGVKRSKTPIVKPSSKADRFTSRPRSLRNDIGKADSKKEYRGQRTSYGVQRATVTAARQAPFVGGITAASTAAHFAPPGQEKKAAARQYGLGVAAPSAAAVGAAYGGAHLAERSARGHALAEDVLRVAHNSRNRVRRAAGLADKPAGALGEKLAHPSPLGRAMQAAARSKAGAPLLGSRRRMVGAAAAYGATKVGAGVVGDQSAITLNHRAQQRYNAKHKLSKAEVAKFGGRGQSKREKHELARTKRTNAALSVAGGTAGLTGLALLPTKHKHAAVYASTVGGGIGGLNALIGAKVQRREAKVIDPVKKVAVPLPRPGMSRGRFMSVYGGNKGTRQSFKVPASDLQALRLPGADQSYEPHVVELRESIRRKGQREPLQLGEIQGEPRLVEGHHRQRALQDLDKDAVVRWGSGRTKSQVRQKLLRNQRRVRQGSGWQKKIDMQDLRSFGKSLVPGRGYKPATQLSSMERSLVRVGKPHRVVRDTPDAPLPNRLPRYAVIPGIGRRRIIGMRDKDRFVLEDGTGRRIVHRNRLTITKALPWPDGSKAWGFRRIVVSSYEDMKAGKPGLSWPQNDFVASPKRLDRTKRRPRPGTSEVGKREDSWKQRPPLKTSVSEGDAKKLIDRHGLKGPLPKTLDREQRRAAYEARYVSAGGRKAEHWQRRAIVADKVKTGGLAAATAAGVPWVASRTGAGRAVGRALARKVPAARKVNPKKLVHHAETTAGGAAVVSGAAEIYAGHARRKRSSYASAPAGVAASALRRMQDYDRSS